jgi:tol-pal system protein YbgF
VDGVQGEVQPGETDSFNAASQQFRNGDFKNAAASFRTFIAKFPNSPYQPTAQYWLGNALYALRDYKGSTATWQGVVKKYPQHPRAPEALLAIATISSSKVRRLRPRRRWSRSSRSTAARTSRSRLRASCRRSSSRTRFGS